MQLSLSLSLLLAAFSSKVANAHDWKCYNGHFYKLVEADGPLDWAGADEAAKALTYMGASATLVSITSLEEHMFIMDEVLVPVDHPIYYWLGATRDLNQEDEEDQEWTWVNGDTWDYTFWAYLEPGPTESCLSINTVFGDRFEYPHKWNDAPCDWANGNGIWQEGVSQGTGFIAEVAPDLPDLEIDGCMVSSSMAVTCGNFAAISEISEIEPCDA